MGTFYNSMPAKVILNDSNTVAWYSFDAPTMTLDASGNISRWNDKFGSGIDLIQNTNIYRPICASEGALFDGIDDFMKTASFTWNQPQTVYIVWKGLQFLANKHILDGNASYSMRFFYGSTGFPLLRGYAGNFQNLSYNLSINTFGLGILCFNSSTGFAQINSNPKEIFDFGTQNAGGLTVGSRGDGGSSYSSNIQVKEIIIRNVVDTTLKEQQIINYLKVRHNI